MELKAGTRLQSDVCDGQFVVVKAPTAGVELKCGGAPLLPLGSESGGSSLDPDLAEGALLGKRYADEELGLELLCSKAGKGSLTCNGAPLGLKGAKPLPASD